MAERLRGRAAVAQRTRRLAAEPLCRRCAEAGRVTAATVPDHIIALVNGGTDDDGNIQCLCEPCHRTKTAEDLGRRARVAIGPDGWPEEP
jgi:5-methylcytosine-specific restriction protein A